MRSYGCIKLLFQIQDRTQETGNKDPTVVKRGQWKDQDPGHLWMSSMESKMESRVEV